MGDGPVESMTGFSMKSLEEKGFIVSFKIKSLNSRYLEIKTNLPAEFFQLEKQIREAVQRSFKRGGFEVSAAFLNLTSSVKELKPWVKSF